MVARSTGRQIASGRQRGGMGWDGVGWGGMGWGGVGWDGVWWGLSACGLSVALAVMVCYRSYEKLSHRRRIAPIGHYRTSIGHYRTIGHYRSDLDRFR